tara:strand:- start:289 stop:594 length:306 start_codon:yes stop_codon:yes gene_type:complete
MGKFKGPKTLEKKTKTELLAHIEEQTSLSFDMAMLIDQLMDLLEVDSIDLHYQSDDIRGFQVAAVWKRKGCDYFDEMDGSAALSMILGAAIAKKAGPESEE